MSNVKKFENILTEDFLIDAYNRLGTLRDIAKEIKTDHSTIKRYMDQYNIPYKSQVRYTCDEEFFTRDNELSFYFAGFISADGCLLENLKSCKQESIKLQISCKDIDLLYKFRESIKTDRPIHQRTIVGRFDGYPDSVSNMCEINVISQKFVDGIKRFNITPRKSLTYKMPTWMKNHPLRHHFLRGSIDGDGCFHLRKMAKNRKTQQRTMKLCGTYDYLSSVWDILNNDLDLNLRSNRSNIYQDKNIFVLTLGGNQTVYKIAKYLYQDATIFLQRKYDAVRLDEIEVKRNNQMYFTKELLTRAIEQYGSQKAVAIELNTSPKTIRKYMKKYNIRLLKNVKPSEYSFDTNDLTKVYQINNSIPDVARHFKIDYTTAKRHLQLHGIIP